MVNGGSERVRNIDDDELEGVSLLSESTVSPHTTYSATRRKSTYALGVILPWIMNIVLLFIIFYLIKNRIEISVDQSQLVYCKCSFVIRKLLLNQ